VASDPKTFVGSAIADVSMAVFQAVKDAQVGKFPAGTVQKIGINNPLAVSLSMASDVPAEVRQRVAEITQALAKGQINVPEAYDGPEFQTPT
jgi:basic membrane protein A